MKNKKYDEIYKKSQNKMKFLDKNKIVVVLQRSRCNNWTELTIPKTKQDKTEN